MTFSEGTITKVAATAVAAAYLASAGLARAEDTIKVGVLHSLSGTMAISETTLKDAMLMVIDEQNKKGGLLGKSLEAVVVDPASDWPLFAKKARELSSPNKVAAVFGCWTSVSRKSVLPVFKELNSVLFYPVQYEGEESERNVLYTGAAPNQQAIPAVDYLMDKEKVERLVIRPLYGRPPETLLATWGVSLIMQQSVRMIFGPTNREVGNPCWASGAFELGQLSITYNRMWLVIFALAVFFALHLLMTRTWFRLQVRAVTQDRHMASAIGIRTPWIGALTFAVGSGIAGIAGVGLPQIDNVSPDLGQSYSIDSFMVVVLGGVGSRWGTLVASMTLGIVNKLLEPFAGAVLGKILVLVFIILFIQKRPRGLFVLKGRFAEA